MMERLGHALLGAFIGIITSFATLIWLADSIGWRLVFVGVFLTALICSAIAARYGEPALLKMKAFLDTFTG